MDGAVQRRNIGLRSVLRALYKRKLLAGFVSLAGTAVAVTVVQFLPATYRAETVILVESKTAGEQSSSGTPEADLQSQLRTQRQRVLSYARLLELVREFNLYAGERRRLPEGDIVEMARRDIDVTLERAWNRGRPGAFRVSFQGRYPQVVAAVANRVAGLFIEDSVTTRNLRSTGASEFLQNQVQEALAQVRAQETRLNGFKTRNAGELPQQESALLADLSRLQLQLQGVQDGISRTEQNKVLAETMLAAAQRTESSSARAADKPQAASVNEFDETVRKETERLQKQLDTLRLRYTDEHPEIRHTRQLLAKVWSLRSQGTPAGQAEAAKDAGGPAPATSPEAASQSQAREKERVDSLKAQRDLAVNQLQALEAERKRLGEQIGVTQAGISRLPAREQELIALNRDYEIAKANYQFLVDKSLATQVTTEMEKRQEPESYSILEPARAPQRPVKPNLNLLRALGAGIALLLGVGIGLGTEFKSGVVLGEWELPREVAILGRVPGIRGAAGFGGRSGGKWARRLAWGAFSLIVVAALIGVGLYLRWIPV